MAICQNHTFRRLLRHIVADVSSLNGPVLARDCLSHLTSFHTTAARFIVDEHRLFYAFYAISNEAHTNGAQRQNCFYADPLLSNN